jgi:hypothetical protein
MSVGAEPILPKDLIDGFCVPHGRKKCPQSTILPHSAEWICLKGTCDEREGGGNCEATITRFLCGGRLKGAVVDVDGVCGTVEELNADETAITLKARLGDGGEIVSSIPVGQFNVLRLLKDGALRIVGVFHPISWTFV